MADFTNREVKVFDLLTVLVMVEQCEPDLTMVEYVLPYHDRVSGAMCLTRTNTRCMACVLRMHSGQGADARSQLITEVKRGNFQIIGIHPRCELNPCTTCPPLRRF